MGGGTGAWALTFLGVYWSRRLVVSRFGLGLGFMGVLKMKVAESNKRCLLGEEFGVWDVLSCERISRGINSRGSSFISIKTNFINSAFVINSHSLIQN